MHSGSMVVSWPPFPGPCSAVRAATPGDRFSAHPHVVTTLLPSACRWQVQFCCTSRQTERAIMLHTKETVNSCFWSNHDNMTLRILFLERRIVRPTRTAKPNMRHALQTLSKHRPPWFGTSTHIKAKHATCGFKRFRRIAILNGKVSFRPSKCRPWCLSEPCDPPSSKHVLGSPRVFSCHESSSNGSEN